jgi:hypothetical protein
VCMRRLDISEVNSLIGATITGFDILNSDQHFYTIYVKKDGKEYIIWYTTDDEMVTEEIT